MKDKEKYYLALKCSNSNFDEIELGEKLGFTEEKTRQIISLLLSEYKIEYIARACSYRIMKPKK